MTISEYEAFALIADEIEDRVLDDTRFPTIEDEHIKRCCKTALELSKFALHCLKNRISDASKKENQDKRDWNPNL